MHTINMKNLGLTEGLIKESQEYLRCGQININK
jgi:hypothetical protein